ncbi:MAG: hypothetical protein ACRDZZ_13780, partial [Ilumatobacteraceae bacterium]
MIDPVVRAAGPGDVAQLMALEGEARAMVVEQRGGTRWLDEHALIGAAWLERIQRDKVFVASIDEVLVGYALVVDDARISRVDQVFVTPGARQLGFGDG